MSLSTRIMVWGWPVTVCQIRTAPSPLPEASQLPSGDGTGVVGVAEMVCGVEVGGDERGLASEGGLCWLLGADSAD
jgi:hypothetical protein